MHLIIGGCGRVGAQLADRLSAEGHDVVVVDSEEAAFRRLGSTFNGETIVGDVTDRDVLLRAGIERADGLTAVTRSDNANLMAVEIASALFSVPQTVARLYDPEREPSYRKMGVQYVSETSIVATAVRNRLRPDAFAHVVAGPDPHVELVEIRVGEAGHGRTVAELEREGLMRVAAIRRGERSRLPRLDDRILDGDVVVAAVRHGLDARLRELVCEER